MEYDVRVSLTKDEIESMLSWFDDSFVFYLQDPDNEVDNMAWVANMCSVYNKMKNSLKTFEVIVDKQMDVCYNNITVKECDNSSTDSVSDELKVCSCYDDRQRYDGRRGICLGTRECDPCDCGGDIRQCDYYPEKRG